MTAKSTVTKVLTLTATVALAAGISLVSLLRALPRPPKAPRPLASLLLAPTRVAKKSRLSPRDSIRMSQWRLDSAQWVAPLRDLECVVPPSFLVRN